MSKPSTNSSSSAESRFYERVSDAPSELKVENSQAGGVGLPLSDRYFHVFQHLASYRPSDCVELGIGGALYLPMLGASCDRLTLIDLVDRTGAFRAPNVTFVQHNLNDDFPLPTGGVDAVIALMVVEHLFDPFHSITEVARVLRPGGWFYLNLPLVTSIRNRWRLLTGRLPNTSRDGWYEMREWDGGHLHYFTLRLIKRLLAESGFRDLTVHPVGRFRWLKALRPELFCGEITLIARRG